MTGESSLDGKFRLFHDSTLQIYHHHPVCVSHYVIIIRNIISICVNKHTHKIPIVDDRKHLYKA